MEAATWVEANFPQPEPVKTWLKERRPDLYDKLFPKNRELSPRLREVQQKLLWPNLGKGIQAYLTQHPEVRGIFWGKGGGTFLRRNLHPMENRFLGLFVVDNRWDVMSALGTYPGDVWQLVEDSDDGAAGTRRQDDGHRSRGDRRVGRHQRGAGAELGSRRVPARTSLYVSESGNRTLRLFSCRLPGVSKRVAAARARSRSSTAPWPAP